MGVIYRRPYRYTHREEELMPFTATYGGTCGDCGLRIKPGDDATYNSDDTLVHDSCDNSKPEPVVDTCTSCFIQKPCPCQDGQ
jgi:hypothetical protein